MDKRNQDGEERYEKELGWREKKQTWRLEEQRRINSLDGNESYDTEKKRYRI